MSLKRRNFIQKIAYSVSILSVKDAFGNTGKFDLNQLKFPQSILKKDFKKTNNRVWLGEQFWSIPLEDWRVKNGRVESDGIVKNASVNILGYQLQKGDGTFSLSCKAGLIKSENDNATFGFSVGVKDTTDPESTSAACYFGNGIKVGISLNKEIFIENDLKKLSSDFDLNEFELKLTSITKNNISELIIRVKDKKGRTEVLSKSISQDLSGLMDICQLEKGASFWWNKLELEGSKVIESRKDTFGPIFWCMYTLSDQTLKLTAQFPPISEEDNRSSHLELQKNGVWESVQTQQIDRDAFTAVFKVKDWTEMKDTPYRVVYELDGNTHHYQGIVRKEPKGDLLKLGALTCQHAMGFPYRPLVENLSKSNPDLLYFSGDQIYEENGGYPIKREPEEKAILSYLGKYYMFGWAFGHLMRDRPTVCTPDDHDVFQGNLWGEGGKLLSIDEWDAQRDAQGGMVQTAKMINVVNKTQCGHLPDAFHPEVLPSGISTWYTHLRYGGVSFAIVSDRMFKSGPEMIRKGQGRIDHVTVRLNANELESESLSMMGNTQMEFLKDWTEDWKDVDMKVMLSQTLFANVATHHGPKKEFLYGDLDSGGWPKKQRDEVLRLMQKAAVFHVNGDQHLPFLVQYSIDHEQDGGWTFCTPAVSTGYPRWSKPDSLNVPYINRPAHGLPNTGLYRDIFGNDNFVFAVGNPEEEFDQEKNRYVKAQKKASGYGFITFNTQSRTIKMEAIRFLADLSKNVPGNSYPGWPLTIKQMENDGRRAIGFLPKIKTTKPNQVFKIYLESTGDLVSATRALGYIHKPAIFMNGTYRISIGEGKNLKVLSGVHISLDPEEEISI